MAELSGAMVREIIFAMENQAVRHAFDVERHQLVAVDSLSESERPSPERLEPGRRYVSLPSWTSADGFHLMARFTEEVRNPIARAALQEILDSGKRVFRRFKDTIREHPELDRRFSRFKLEQMRPRILEWYATVMELESSDAIELGADEEWDEIVASEIAVEVMSPVPATLIEELDRQAWHEAYRGESPALLRHRYRRRRASLPGVADARSAVFAATSGGGDLCGFAWLVTDPLEDGTVVHQLAQVYVAPDFRGLGVATRLVEVALASLPAGSVVSATVPTGVPALAHILARAGLDAQATLIGGRLKDSGSARVDGVMRTG